MPHRLTSPRPPATRPDRQRRHATQRADASRSRRPDPSPDDKPDPSGGSSGSSWLGFGSRGRATPEPDPHHPYDPPFARDAPTLWGLSPWELHDRAWAARGVQVVRQGVKQPLRHNAELFLLLDPYQFVHFSLKQFVSDLNWLQPLLVTVRLHHGPERDRYGEWFQATPEGVFTDFDRDYDRSIWGVVRVGLTPSLHVAQAWQEVSDTCEGWRRLRREIPRERRCVRTSRGMVSDSRQPAAVSNFIHNLLGVWHRPDATIGRAKLHKTPEATLWHDETAAPTDPPRCVGAIWLGAGRSLPDDGQGPIIGPAVFWDDPAHRPDPPPLRWGEIEPTRSQSSPVHPRRVTSFYRTSKRAFDIFAGLIGMTVCIIAGIFIVPAIWLEDRGPIFFGHRRQTLGGGEFTCWKFRSMKKNAAELKEQIRGDNVADGNQFYVENDTRVTRVGDILRKLDLDELPQFWNVLKGEMSLVGPRPSPDDENQLSPGWREARLTVRPGITGLWQVERSREAGKDFQEWIVYDIRYVETMCWSLDIKIILRTILKMIGIRLPFAGWGGPSKQDG